MKVVRRKYIALFIFGALLGGLEGGLHGQSWNRPVNHTSLISCFVLFPIVFIYLALTISSLKELVKLVIVCHVGWIVSWTMTHCLVYRWFFDDPVLMTPVFVLAHLAYSVVIHEVRLILPERMKEEDFTTAVFSTGRILCAKAHFVLRSLKPILQHSAVRRGVILAVVLLVAFYFGSFAVGGLALKFSDKAEAIRQGIGREVLLDSAVSVYAGEIKGKLTEVGYQFEPAKPWIIYLRVGIKYEYAGERGHGSGSISTILSPFELDRIEFVESRNEHSGESPAEYPG